MHENKPYKFDLIQTITVKIMTLFFQKGKNTRASQNLAKFSIKRLDRRSHKKILETRAIERIIFSTYQERMAALQYVPVHVSQNPRQSLTKIIRRFSFLLYRLVVQVCNYKYGTALKYWSSITKSTGHTIINSKKEIRRIFF